MRTILFGILMVAATMPCMAADTLPPDLRVQLEAAINTPYPSVGATGEDVRHFMVAKATACERMRPYLKRLKTETSFMHCVFDGYADAWRAAGAPNIDLAEQLVTGEFAIADRLDRHQISVAQKDAEFAELISRIQTQAQIRTSSAQQATAAQQAATAQQQAAQAQQQAEQAELTRQQQEAESVAAQRRANAYLWLGQRLLNPPPPKPTTTTNCIPFGPGFQCTTQ